MIVDAVNFDLGTSPEATLRLASSEGLSPLPLPEAILRFQSAMRGDGEAVCMDYDARRAVLAIDGRDAGPKPGDSASPARQTAKPGESPRFFARSEMADAADVPTALPVAPMPQNDVAPAIASAPMAERPAATEKTAVVGKPVVAEKPVAAERPVAAEKPVATDGIVVAPPPQPAKRGDVRVAFDVPTSALAPTPAADSADETVPPREDAVPALVSVSATEKPVMAEKSIVTENPAAAEKFAAVGKPVLAEKPVVAERLVAVEKPGDMGKPVAADGIVAVPQPPQPAERGDVHVAFHVPTSAPASVPAADSAGETVPPREDVVQALVSVPATEKPIAVAKPAATEKPVVIERPVAAAGILVVPQPSQPAGRGDVHVAFDMPTSASAPVPVDDSAGETFPPREDAVPALVSVPATEKPVMAEKSIVTESSVVPEKPVVPERPVAAERPVVPERPVAAETFVVAGQPVEAARPFAEAFEVPTIAMPEKPVVMATDSKMGLAAVPGAGETGIENVAVKGGVAEGSAAPNSEIHVTSGRETAETKEAPRVFARREVRDLSEAAVELPAAPTPQVIAAAEAVPEPHAAATQTARTEAIAEAVGKTVEIVNQVVEAVVAEIAVTSALAQGDGEVRITLQPTVLDGSEIRLTAKSGELMVSIAPATVDSAQVVQQNLTHLESALAAHAPSFHHVAVVVAATKKGKVDETA